MVQFNNTLKELRKSKGLTQVELGKRLGVSSQVISNWERGYTTGISADTLALLSEIFNVSSDDLLGTAELKRKNMPYRATNRSISNNIRYWIRKSFLGDDEVAERLGISEELLEDYCSGEALPSLEVLQALSEICNVSTDCLLGMREKSRPAEPDGNMPFRFDPEISRRLKEQAKQMNESYTFIASILGIEESEVFNFFEYGFVPHISIFAKIVEHYLVSSDYLLNLSNSTMTVQPDEEELLKTYRGLTEKNKVRGLGRLYDLEEAQSAVAATGRATDSQEKSLPSSGTEG